MSKYKKVFFTPGPSELYFTVPDHIRTALRQHIPSISHRSEEFKNLFQETTETLKSLLNVPDGYHIVFTSSANEIWERIIQNVVQKKSFHFINGAFSQKFYDFAIQYGIDADQVKAENGECIDPSTVTIQDDVELIAMTHNETSTGANQPLEDIAMMREKYPEKLIALDIVSSAPSYSIDLTKVDTAYFSVQKCFGLPAGLGVWIYNDRFLQKHLEVASNKVTGSYHQLGKMHQMGQKYQTPETPNILGIFLLNEVAKDLLRRGHDAIWSETRYKSALLYHNLNNHPLFEPFVKNEKYRSHTTLVFETLNQEKVLSKLTEENMIVGKGYGQYKESQIRIANFPTHSKEQAERLVDTLLSIQ